MKNAVNMITPNDFHASDLFSKWRSLIKKASISIKIFTPYLDSSLIELIKKQFGKTEITIITRLDSDTVIEKAFQLKTIRNLLVKGIVVKNCEFLHAKVLIIDDDMVSVGSQNFTHQGRLNKEAGYISTNSFKGSEFLECLNNWNNQAENIDVELIEELLEYYKDAEKDIKKLKNKITGKLNEIVENYKESKKNQQIQFNNNYNSVYRFAQGEVILTRTQIPPDYYYSYFAGGSNNLCKWIKKSKNKEETTEFRPYQYYTALNKKTNELRFVRIHTSRITFTISSFSPWNGLKLGGLDFEIVFNFLNEKPQFSNIEITLSNYSLGSITLVFYFNGKDFNLISVNSESENCKSFIVKHLLSKPKLRQFLITQLKPHSFITSPNAPKDIESFLGDVKYRLYIANVSPDCPVLVFENLS